MTAERFTHKAALVNHLRTGQRDHDTVSVLSAATLGRWTADDLVQCHEEMHRRFADARLEAETLRAMGAGQ